MPGTRTSPTDIIDTLRMNERDLMRLLERMARQARANETVVPHAATVPASLNAGSVQGQACLAVLNLPRALIGMADPSPAGAGRWRVYLVKPRDVHPEAMVFLHGGFVHTGTRCALLARDAAGQPARINATIISARHVSGRIHELTARFDEPLPPHAYVHADGSPILAPSQDAQHSV